MDKAGNKNKEESDQILESLNGAEYKVAEVESKEARRLPGAPFTTSTLQQESSGKLGYSAKQTMMLCPTTSYEAGYISYMRTDSGQSFPRLLCRAPKSFIDSNLRPRLFASPNRADSKTKPKERKKPTGAVRPTVPSRTPDSMKDLLDPKQFKI